VPDEIFISITLHERMDGKTKISIDSLEHELVDALKENKIDVKNLSTHDLASGYVKIRWHGKDVMQSKEYSLKVSTAEETQTVFQIVYDLKIYDADIWKTDYSKRDSIEEVVRVEAIDKAKPQANYMLKPLDKWAGKTLIVREDPYYGYSTGYMYGGDQTISNQQGIYMRGARDYSYKTDVEFQKITFRSNMFVRFEITP